MRKKHIGTAEQISEEWHAVIILSPGTSCVAAAACRGLRFLSAEAPRLPLSECDRPESCPCTYRHYADRRAKKRRAAETGKVLGTPTKPVAEKRVARGRRSTDQ
jgi:hypothetical protein